MTGAAPTDLNSNAWLPALASKRVRPAIQRGNVIAYLDVMRPRAGADLGRGRLARRCYLCNTHRAPGPVTTMLSAWWLLRRSRPVLLRRRRRSLAGAAGRTLRS